MAGAVIIVLVLVVVLPVCFWAVWGLMGFLLSHLLTDYAEETHQGSDLVETNY